jgi:hypothetical protein
MTALSNESLASAMAADSEGRHRQKGQGSDGRISDRHTRWPGWLCCGLYLVFTILEFGPSNGLSAADMAGARTEDQIQQIWFLEWVPYALAHGHNPFFTQWQNYPVGFNTLVDPSMVALGTIFSPVTYLFGPVVTWNVLLRLAVVLSATSMCLVLRRWTRWWPAAFIGGLLYGFSAYAISYGAGYLFLVFVPLPPLVLLLLHEILVRQEWPPARTGGLLGIACGVQYLISSEVLAMTLLMGGLACAVYLISRRKHLAPKLRYIRTAVGWGVVVGAVLLVYPVYFTLFGTGHINGVPQGPADLAFYHGDLLGSIVPSSQWLSTSHLRTVSLLRLTWSASMYVGLPLLIGLIVIVVWLRKLQIVLFLGFMTAVALVLSLGSTLYVDGHDTHIPLPFIFLANLPFTDGIMATRLSLFVALFGASLLAIGLDELYRRLKQSTILESWPRGLREIVNAGLPLMFALIVAIPLFPSHSQRSSATNVPTFFTSGRDSAVPNGSVVLAYPYPSALAAGLAGVFYIVDRENDVLLGQSLSGMRFKVIGGYGSRQGKVNGIVGPTPLVPLSVETLFQVAYSGVGAPAQLRLLANSDLKDDLRMFMARYHVDTVIVLHVGQNSATVISHVTAAIGKPVISGGVTAWFHVQHRLAAISGSVPSP